MKDFTELALECKGVRMRVTLAVPLANDTGVVDRLRVWAYDETHTDRRYTELPVQPDDQVLAGAPAAFRKGAVEIIDDLRTVEGAPNAASREYRSILSMPIKIAGNNGRPLAIVNVDADQPDFFTADGFLKIRPLIYPVVNAIGIALTLKEARAYDFPE